MITSIRLNQNVENRNMDFSPHTHKKHMSILMNSEVQIHTSVQPLFACNTLDLGIVNHPISQCRRECCSCETFISIFAIKGIIKLKDVLSDWASHTKISCKICRICVKHLNCRGIIYKLGVIKSSPTKRWGVISSSTKSLTKINTPHNSLSFDYMLLHKVSNFGNQDNFFIYQKSYVNKHFSKVPPIMKECSFHTQFICL